LDIDDDDERNRVSKTSLPPLPDLTVICSDETEVAEPPRKKLKASTSEKSISYSTTFERLKMSSRNSFETNIPLPLPSIFFQNLIENEQIPYKLNNEELMCGHLIVPSQQFRLLHPKWDVKMRKF
jgi:hypothetical protein